MIFCLSCAACGQTPSILRKPLIMARDNEFQLALSGDRMAIPDYIVGLDTKSGEVKKD
jgi:hypothetical protein